MSAHPAPGKRIQTQRLTIHVRIEGDGPPLLFLGGSNFDLSIRAPVFDSKLTDHFTVAAADPRGLGLTDKPDGVWTMADYAADAAALMDALGWQDANVLGESFGAMAALHLAHRYPERISAMTLVAGAPGGEGRRSYPIHELQTVEAPKERALAALRVQDLNFHKLEKDDPAGAKTLLEARITRDERFLAHQTNREGYPRLLAARADHDCWDVLPSITTPTLVIAGERDGQAPIALSRAMAERMPNARLISFPAGHNVCFATPEPVQSILDSWASRTSMPQQTEVLA